ncbi:MAG: formyltransferase family protein [Pseudomonadota bacterium]
MPVFEAHHFKYIISNSWPTKLPATFFKLAGIEAMNVHSSCLPYYRGGNRTYAPLINKEKFSGVTLHTLNDELDAGAIIKRIKFPIDKHETPKSLVRKGATYINDLLLEGLKIAGQKDNYLPNPPSPMYYSCGYAVYLKFKAVNFFRSLCKLPTLKLTPGKRHKFFDKI